MRLRGAIVIIIVFALTAIAYFIYNVPGTQVDSPDSPAGGIPSASGESEPPRRAAETGSRHADRPQQTARPVTAAPPRESAPATVYDIVIINVDDELQAQFDDDESQPVGKGRTGQLSGSIHVDHEGVELPGARLEIVAGLNAGRKTTVEKDGRYKFDRLYPGAAILRAATASGRTVDREIVILRNLDTRLNVYIGARGSCGIPVYDIQENPVQHASIIAGGHVSKQMTESGAVIENVIPPEILTYISAPGFESRRENIRFGDRATAPIEPKQIILRRAGNVIIKFDLLDSSDPRPVAVLLPASMITKQFYPFEVSGMRKAALNQNEMMMEGVPMNEAFDVRIFCETANAVPALVHLRAIDSTEPVPRIVNFSFERRWTVSGRLTDGTNSIEGATVRAEVIDIADVTDKMFDSNGGIDRVPYPVLPFARRVVTTDRNGKFKVETYDMRRPAYIVFDAPGMARKTIEMPPGGIVDLKDIKMEKESSGDKSSSVIFNFKEAAPRILNIYYTKRSELRGREKRVDPDSSMVARFLRSKKESTQSVRVAEHESEPVNLAPGDYEFYISRQRGKEQTIREQVRGVTRVILDGSRVK